MNEKLIQLGLRGITGTFIGATDSYLAAFEDECGFRLPSAYSDFLKSYGVSVFGLYCGFQPKNPSPWAANGIEAFDVFYGMSEKAFLDVRYNSKRLRENEIITDQQIAIGHDAVSNLVLLNATGEVTFYDRETGLTYLCADNFETFLDSFETLPPVYE